MAEINIERKKRPIWPWVLLVLLIILLIWAFIEFTNDRNEVELEQDEVSTIFLNPANSQHHFITNSPNKS